MASDVEDVISVVKKGGRFKSGPGKKNVPAYQRRPVFSSGTVEGARKCVEVLGDPNGGCHRAEKLRLGPGGPEMSDSLATMESGLDLELLARSASRERHHAL